MENDFIFREVIIIGGGVAGLTLGNILHHLNQDFIIIEPRNTLNRFKIHTGIHSNTLRLFRQIGLEKDILENGVHLKQLKTFVDGKFKGKTDVLQGTLTFEKCLMLSGHTLEKILLDKVEQQIYRPHKMIDFKENEEYVEVNVENITTGHIDKFRCKYLIGADGSDSIVRTTLGIPFEGETSQFQSFTFEAVITNFPEEDQEHIYLKNGKTLIVHRLEGNERFRVYGRVPEENVSLNDVVKERSGLEFDPETLDGLVHYKAESKTAENLGTARVILIGESAHSFYPFGGYGQNISIEDAFCLGWRLKLACSGVSRSMQIIKAF